MLNLTKERRYTIVFKQIGIRNLLISCSLDDAQLSLYGIVNENQRQFEHSGYSIGLIQRRFKVQYTAKRNVNHCTYKTGTKEYTRFGYKIRLE